VSTMKLVGKLLLLLTLILGVSLGAAHLWLGSLIKEAAERIGPKITQTSVKLNDVDISFLAGSTQLIDRPAHVGDSIEAHLDPDSRAILIRNIDQEVELGG